MKNLLLLITFCYASFFCSSQFTVTNNTFTTLTVGVQFTNTFGTCSPDAGFTEPIAPFASYTFPTPPGMMVYRVGYWSIPGSGYAFAPCGGCTLPDATGPFGFWGYTCSSVHIR